MSESSTNPPASDEAVDSALNLLNRTTGALLRLDPDTLERLAGLEGRIVCVHIDPPAFEFFLEVIGSSLAFRKDCERDADVTLKGRVADFLYLGMRRGRNDISTGRGVAIEGDVEVGQSFQRVLGQMDLDWEELLAGFAGDTVARKTGNMFRGLRDWASQSARLSRENFADYLTEERQVLVGDVMMERFQNEVGQLRADTDRLQLRIDRLNKMLDEADRG